MKDGRLDITLQLGEHNVKLPVDLSEEKYYRDAAVTMNQRFKYYSDRMPRKSAEQIWVYVALEMAYNLQRQDGIFAMKPVEDRINQINSLIKESLESMDSDATNSKTPQ